MKRLFAFVALLTVLQPLSAQKNYEEKCLSGDCNNGFGTYQYNTGDTYTGEFWDSKRSGYGIYQWKTSKEIYRGEFKEDALEGMGVYFFTGGNTYIGEFKANNRSGEGKMVYKNGTVEEGLFENDAYIGKISYYGQEVNATGCLYGDCQDGFGVYRHLTGERYFGEFKKGFREGYGTYYFSNGDKYIGDWLEGKIHGYGVFYWATGAKYIGEFNQIAKDGWGIYYDLKGAKKVGLWEADVFVKSKSQYLQDNNGNPCISGDCKEGYGQYIYDWGLYMGNWKNGYMNGKGLYVFDMGDFYDGNFVDNKRNGSGIYYFTEGGVYIGDFKDQYLHGEGFRYLNDGTIQEGFWEEGTYVGKEPSSNYYEILQEVSKLDTAAGEMYGKRLALVIGNSNYAGEGFLPNPVNDAKSITAALKKSGFEVITVYNGSNIQITEAIKQFGSQLNSYTVGLFYYSGHGMQVDGVNYVIPVDAKIVDPTDVRYECVDASRVLAKMEYAGTKVNILIMDACRNNPFTERSRGEVPSEGLAPMNAPAGTFIAYATSPNKTASDGSGSNGLYTEELLKYITYPNLKIEDVFKQVRIKVIEKSGGVQLPWETSSLVGDFYFVKNQ